MTGEGQIIAGRYRLGPVLGDGGMSEVHRARDLRIGRWVAVKLLRPELVRDPTFEGRLRREAQAAAALHGRHVVAVYDVGEERVEGRVTPYIVMELVEGRTLRDALAVDGRMPVREALTVTAAICTALDEAHRTGIVHRDVKPGNVMVTDTGEVKVMDFGIAQAAASSTTMTQDAAVTGTAHYLSPEQARGEHVDARSDIYSTGCLLYELVTGSPPFTGDSAVAIAYQHVREDAVPPSRIAADVGPDLDAVVLKSLAKNPGNRYQTAAELREDLGRVLSGEPVTATALLAAGDVGALPPPPTSVLVREPVRPRNHTVAYTLLGVATAAVFVIALLIARALLGGPSGDLQTPDVVGQTYANAQSVLNSAGLKVGSVTYRYNAKHGEGIVLSQDPSHPILLKRGDGVDLVLSKGTHYVDIPADIIGEQRSAAVSELKDGDLLVKIKPTDNSAPAGQVLSASPTAGQSVPIGSTVTLSVSSGMQPVPGVVGLAAGPAARKLQLSGFAVDEKSSPTYQQGIPTGQVVAQSPIGGLDAASNSTVVVYLNEPPAKPTKSASSSSSPGANSSPSAGASP